MTTILGARDESRAEFMGGTKTRVTRPAAADGPLSAPPDGLIGHFYVHNEDDSGFVCERE